MVDDTQPPAIASAKHVGSGWISGVLSVLLGAIGLGAVLCFHFPSILTLPELRAVYPVPQIRALLHFFLISSFVLGLISVLLRPNKLFGLSGILLTLSAIFLGGSGVSVDDELSSGPFLGLDWFLLNLIAYSLLFVPLEQLFPKRPEQPIFLPSWRTDLTYFFFSALFVQLIAVLTMRPAAIFFKWAVHTEFQTWVSSLPVLVQFAGIVLVADLTQYWIHRAFHVVPMLWRFHAVHHSTQAMDWLAGSRIHIVDVVLTRGLAYIPIYLLGFAEAPLFAYIIFVTVHATFLHANIRFEYGSLKYLIATPQYHHWHHTDQREFINRNYAVHLPVLDRIFGTYYLPAGVWPTTYGITGTANPAGGYFRQFVSPFKRKSI